MPDINQINGLVLCDEIHVNGVTIANITNIDDITKNCCTANGPISLTGPEETCALACASEECSNYYTDGTSGTCPLVNGDYLYTNTSCVFAGNGYYSPKNCVEECDYCYSVTSGVITVTECPDPTVCRTIKLDEDDESCSSACAGKCKTYYTDTPVGALPTVGKHIYKDSECACPEEGGPKYYSDKCGLKSGNCYTMNTSTCAITSITPCGKSGGEGRAR